MADHTCGVTRHDGPCRHIVGDHAAGAHDTAVADDEARQDDGPAADPYVITDPNRCAGFPPLGALGRIQRMRGGEDLHARPELAP